MPRFRRILHPTDFSRASSRAFALALDMARQNCAELILLHVIDPVIPVPTEGYVPPRMYEEIRTSALAWTGKKLDRFVARARASGVRVRGQVLEGVAHEGILRAIRTTRADLCVMGTHGRTGLTRLFLGSVTGRVVSMATCPVLTVRAG
jgi:nucleotide-binding universal stress UspA family protein